MTGTSLTRRRRMASRIALVAASATALTMMGPLASFAADSYDDGAQIPFDSLTWVNDRAEPSGGSTAYEDTFIFGVVPEWADPRAATNSHYRTEGKKAELPEGIDGIAATLEVPAEWESVPNIRAGVWFAAPPNESGGSAWPVIEFSNVGGDPVIRAWQTFGDDSGWKHFQDAEYGTSYQLGIVLDPDTQEWSYLVDGEVVYRISDEAYTTAPTHVLFNNYNHGVDGGGSYDVTWSNLVEVTPAAPAPEPEPEPEPAPTTPPAPPAVQPVIVTAPPTATPPAVPATSPQSVAVPTTIPSISSNDTVLRSGVPAVTPPSFGVVNSAAPLTLSLGSQWAFQWIYVAFYSDPTIIGWVQADANGNISVQAPSNLGTGNHTLAGFAAGGELIAAAQLAIAPAAVDNGSGSGGTAQLANTGSAIDYAPVALGALVLMGLGVALMRPMIVRRRAQQQ